MAETGAQAQGAQAQGAQAPGENGASGETGGPPSIYEYLSFSIQQLAQVGWQKMGMQPDQITGKYETNFSEAKVAIDAINALAKLLEPQLDDQDQRKMQSLVRDLKINFVQKSSGT